MGGSIPTEAINSGNGAAGSKKASCAFYTLCEMAKILGKSPAILYRRLTETPKRYELKYAVKMGTEWRFNKKMVDEGLAKNEAIYTRIKGGNDHLESRVKELFFK